MPDFDYRIEQEFSLAEDGLVKIHAYPFRSYTHPEYGEVTFTREDAELMKQNFDANVLEHDVAWNYQHGKDPAKGTKASGWVRKVEVGEDGLYVFVEPTETAKQELEAGEWKYSSVERRPEWTHPTSGETYKNVLFGGAFTNYPFLKGVAPLNFSDFTIDPETERRTRKAFDLDKPKEAEVDLAALATRLGMKDSATEDEIFSRVDALVERFSDPEDKHDPKLQAFKDTEPELYAEIVSLRDDKKLRDAERFAEGVRTEDGKILAPTHSELVAAAHYKLAKGEITVQEFADTMATATTKGMVKLGESGSSGSNAGRESDKGLQDTRDAAQQFADLAAKRAQEKEIDYVEAMREIADEHPELAEAYANVPVSIMVGGGE